MVENKEAYLSERLAINNNAQKINMLTRFKGDRGSTVAKVLRYKSEGRWLDPRLLQWIFH